ncbi:hypothetical protein RHGRI_035267 [Rhododendron griersonianum]|uniref:Btz domain-containing protein n=1 Tax=Rhododendron griersonianum TaxID=479676 RepID=A0AAV6I6J4_9ERIC|nr:hypothetical protein RHGRI_035267 [Rhododendron griersonianum]
MAGSGQEEVEYESDPEEAKRSLTMRRREASDDEEEREEGDEGEGKVESRAAIESDVESDGQGAPAEYDDEEEEEELEVEGEELEDYEEEEEVVVVVEDYEVGLGENRGEVGRELEEERGREIEGVNQVGEEEDEEGEKKENEPFAVPTAGAFYMHDDRFRGNVGGRNRRTFVGKKLWESKDERKWGHDKFEEITVQERHYEEGTRNSRGRYRAREKNRGADRGYPGGGNKSKTYNNNNQNQGPKSVRGRGPRRYEPSRKNYGGVPPMQHKPRSGRPIEKTLHDSSGRAPMASSNSESDPAPSRKQLFASSLNSASPPFYPSSSSNKEPSLTQKRDEKTMNRNLPNTNTMVRGKSVVGSIGMEKLSINDSATAIGGKPSTSSQLPFSGASLVNTTQPLQSRAQGRGVAPHIQVNRASPPNQLHNVQRNPVQTRVQPSLQASVQQLGQSPVSGSQTSSPPKAALSIKSFQSAEMGSPSESGKSKTALVGKGRGSIQGSGRGSFPYGAQVMGASGNMGGGHSDPNFTFLPVMQFGGQHPGGMGLPAVGMAFPGYVGQPQLGMGNSEMTWLPVLAGAAGALGAAYGSPYLAVDGAYHSRPSGQASSSGASSKETNANKPNNEWKASQRSEAASDEFGQRQKNTRRQVECHNLSSVQKISFPAVISIYRDEFWPVKYIYQTYLDKLIQELTAACDGQQFFVQMCGFPSGFVFLVKLVRVVGRLLPELDINI